MEYPEGLGPFATDAEIDHNLNCIRQLRLDWPEVDVLELNQGQLSLGYQQTLIGDST
jgi:hypothetical protein